MAKSKHKPKKKKSKKSSLRWLWISLIALAVMGVIVAGLIWLIPKIVKTGEAHVGVPQLELQFADGTSFDDFKTGAKTTKYHGNTLTVIDEKGLSKFEDVTVKGRGNTTWERSKKPMQIKFAKKTDFLDMEKTRKWVLLANYLDASQIRNDTAMYVSLMLDFMPTLGGEFVELNVDGDYQGLYYVTHHVEIGKNVVDLRDEKGVLVEIDKGCAFL